MTVARTSMFLSMVGGLLVACGSAEEGIVLEIDSDLNIPAEVDSLFVEVADAAALTKVLGGASWPLTGKQFPRSVSLVPSSSTPERVVVHVTGKLGDVVVAERQAEVQWKRGHIVEAKVDLYRQNPAGP